MVKCSAFNCDSSSHKKIPGITFHRFPKDEALRNAWLNNMKLHNWKPKPSSFLCSRHFESHFMDPSAFRTRLQAGAVPTVFLEFPQVEEKLSQPRKKLKTMGPVLQELQNKMDIGFSSSTCGQQVYESLPGSSKIETPVEQLKYEENIKKMKNKINQKNLKIRALQQQRRRLKKKVSQFSDIISELKSRLNHDDIHILSGIPVNNKDFFARYLKKAKNDALEKSYSPELRSFALQLHFYSPRAYNFVRTTFNTVLPHPGTLSRWYKKVNTEPGFIAESFDTLEAISKSNTNKIFVSISIDEMALRKGLVWDSSKNKYKGYIDSGTEVDDDSLPLATQALVILVNGINCRFKLPIAFFFIISMTGQQRASLMKIAIEMLYKINIFVCGITFDGAASNISMATHLGCKLNLNNLEPYFMFEKMKINIFYDPCHMLKLIRNTLGDFKILKDKEGNTIQFKYFSSLFDLQKEKGLHLANKIKQAHIMFHKQKMKVRLAAQLLSRSVADAFMFCKDQLNLAAFNDCTATVTFVKIINDAFDFLNSRSTLAPGNKKALCVANINRSKELVIYWKDYLQNLRFIDGKLIVESARKTGFVGFIISLISALNVYEELIVKEKLKFIPLYSFSQDHLEMFFGKMRARGGFNDNPNVIQFESSLKRLIIHAKITLQNNGFAIPNPILHASSTVKFETILNDTTASFERNVIENNDIEEDIQNFLENVLSAPLDEYTHHVTIYIAGFIARKIMKIVTCGLCHILVLGKKDNFLGSLINVKDRGGLVYPSDGLIKIIHRSERAYKLHKNKKISYNALIDYVAQSFEYNTIFNSNDLEHDTNHAYILIKLIIKKYIDLRCRHDTKKENNVSERNYLKKIVLFKNK